MNIHIILFFRLEMTPSKSVEEARREYFQAM